MLDLISAIVGLVVALLVIAGTLGGWLWKLQARLHREEVARKDEVQALKLQIEVMKVTSLQQPAFSAAMDQMRSWVSAGLSEVRRELHTLTTTVAQLVDREGGVSYQPTGSRADAIKDRRHD